MSKPFVAIEKAAVQWTSDLPSSTVFDDIYHSMDSGIEHSMHTFIEGNNLFMRWGALSESSVFSIGETGFGTGLNFLLTWSLWDKYAPSTASLHFISCEKHPLARHDLERALSNWPQLANYKEELLKQYPILTPGNHLLSFGEGRVKLTLMLGDCYERFEQLLLCGDSIMEHRLRTSFIDAWYLDGFAPKKNEDMWSRRLIQVLGMLSGKGTTFATYTVAASVKSNLQACGFVLEKKKGFRSKRHMLTGYLDVLPICRTPNRTTPWHVSVPAVADRTVAVVGAGLAGCFVAYTLAQKGWQVTLFEENEAIAQGASGNQRTVLFPKLSAFQSPFTEYMLASFLYAHGFYKEILEKIPLGELKGIITIPHNDKEYRAQQALTPWLACYPELGQLISIEQANALSGIILDKAGLYIPLSGWINSPLLCDYLINHPNIHLVPNTAINSLERENEQWMLGGYQASAVVLANGFKINQFIQTRDLPIKPIRGQMSSIAANSASRSLKLPVCAEGHVVPAVDGFHFLGATYELGVATAHHSHEDDRLNRSKLKEIDPQTVFSEPIESSWVGVRASTPDYLPLVGPVPVSESFKCLYAELQTNAKRWIPEKAPYYQGLYAFAGFGSRGLTTIPLAAEWLARLMNNDLTGSPRNLVQSLSPARFITRSIIRDLSV